jgi:hypothetical protein
MLGGSFLFSFSLFLLEPYSVLPVFNTLFCCSVVWIFLVSNSTPYQGWSGYGLQSPSRDQPNQGEKRQSRLSIEPKSVMAGTKKKERKQYDI